MFTHHRGLSRRFIGIGIGNCHCRCFCINVIADGCCGPFGQFVNFVRQMGAHPGRRLEMWIARNIQRKTDSKNITFRQVYIHPPKLIPERELGIHYW